MTLQDFVKFAIENNMRKDPAWALLYLKAFWSELPPSLRRRYLRKLVKSKNKGPSMLNLALLNEFLQLWEHGC